MRIKSWDGYREIGIAVVGLLGGWLGLKKVQEQFDEEADKRSTPLIAETARDWKAEYRQTREAWLQAEKTADALREQIQDLTVTTVRIEARLQTAEKELVEYKRLLVLCTDAREKLETDHKALTQQNWRTATALEAAESKISRLESQLFGDKA